MRRSITTALLILLGIQIILVFYAGYLFHSVRPKIKQPVITQHLTKEQVSTHFHLGTDAKGRSEYTRIEASATGYCYVYQHPGTKYPQGWIVHFCFDDGHIPSTGVPIMPSGG